MQKTAVSTDAPVEMESLLVKIGLIGLKYFSLT